MKEESASDDNNWLGDNYFENENELGSKRDLANVAKNPLPQGAFCLYQALHLSTGDFVDFNLSHVQNYIPPFDEKVEGVDKGCYEMALVSLAYVKLQLEDTKGYQEITQNFLGDTELVGSVKVGV